MLHQPKKTKIIVFAFGTFSSVFRCPFFLLYFILLKKFCSFINFPLYFNSSHSTNTTSSKWLKTWNNNSANVNKQWYSIWRASFVRFGYVLVVHQRQSYHVVWACVRARALGVCRRCMCIIVDRFESWNKSKCPWINCIRVRFYSLSILFRSFDLSTSMYCFLLHAATVTLAATAAVR